MYFIKKKIPKKIMRAFQYFNSINYVTHDLGCIITHKHYYNNSYCQFAINMYFQLIFF